MKQNSEIILVGGATGRQGGAVVRHLLKQDWQLRALTRDPNRPQAKVLAEQGVDVRQGDMEDLDSLIQAMEGAYGVFSVQDFWTVGGPAEIRQGCNMADAAAATGIEHFIYSSVEAAEKKTGADHYESKFVIEEHIRQVGLPATILRPVGFMENYHIPHVKKRLLKGKLADPLAAHVKIQLIPTDDIGAFAAAVFDEPQRFVGQAIEIASDELTGPEIAETFTRVLGRPVRYKQLPMLLTRLFLGKELYRMFRWYNRAGFSADLPALRTTFPQVQLTSLERWLRRDGWATDNQGAT